MEQITRDICILSAQVQVLQEALLQLISQTVRAEPDQARRYADAVRQRVALLLDLAADHPLAAADNQTTLVAAAVLEAAGHPPERSAD